MPHADRERPHADRGRGSLSPVRAASRSDAALLAEAAAAGQPLSPPPRPLDIGLSRCITTPSSALAAQCLAERVLVSRVRDEVTLEDPPGERRTLLFLYDAETDMLHGVFEPDSAAAPLPRDSLPGDRPYQLRMRPLFHFPLPLPRRQVEGMLTSRGGGSSRSTFHAFVGGKAAAELWEAFVARHTAARSAAAI